MFIFTQPVNSGVTRSVVPLALGNGVAPMNLVVISRPNSPGKSPDAHRGTWYDDKTQSTDLSYRNPLFADETCHRQVGIPQELITSIFAPT
ncbi:MAG: hypothetical protein A2W85_13985 [Bacteroidetes bacterium GWF2_41_31]|nr:MAG: hypothetical protein A2W85_13985 [Bacteroidetes bacterium GWF2_41_31]